MFQLPKVRPHGQVMLVLCWKPPFQSVQREREGGPKVCQFWRGSRYHQQCLPQNGSSDQEIKGSTSSGPDKVINRTNHKCVIQEICSHHGGLTQNFSGGRSSSTPTTETYRRSDETTGHPKDSCYHQGNKGTDAPATGDTQYNTTQTTGRKSAMWSRTKKPTVETTTTTGGRNRSHHYYSGRGNSLVEYKPEKMPHSSTQENDRSSSKCDRYTNRIDSVLLKKYHTSCSHTACSENGPFHGVHVQDGFDHI